MSRLEGILKQNWDRVEAVNEEASKKSREEAAWRTKLQKAMDSKSCPGAPKGRRLMRLQFQAPVKYKVWGPWSRTKTLRLHVSEDAAVWLSWYAFPGEHRVAELTGTSRREALEYLLDDAPGPIHVLSLTSYSVKSVE